MQGIVKTFPGICALDHVDFNVRSGEVHALIGENGAGKSTLMNVLAGLFHDYQGCITFAGQPVKIINPRQGLELGIAVIYQELNVLPNFSVAENIMLDEPTASLGSEDVEKLFRVIKKLRDKGLGIVYISHRLAELPGIADRVTVLRDGRAVGTKALAECKVSDLTRMMLGHELAEVFPEKTNQPGPTILKVEGLSRKGMFENISFELRQGEILGIAGLVGSGRTEIARAVFGADKASGNVEFLGTNVTKNNPSQSRKLGIAMIPEDRKLQGNITGRPIGENLNISILDKLAGYLGFQSPRKLHDRAMYMIDRMEIEPGLPGTNIQNLSGGNQQKVVVGRWLALDSKVIIFDEPTQGIDMGTKSQIYNLIMDLACKGQGIILISSELLEIAKLADRILIIRDGRLTDELKGKGIDEDNLFAACAGKSKSQ
jgi:ribose transport system ATP-binding protein